MKRPSPYNWIGCHPLYTCNQTGSFHSLFTSLKTTRNGLRLQLFTKFENEKNSAQNKQRERGGLFLAGISWEKSQRKFLNILVDTLAWSVGFSSKPLGSAKAGLPNGQLLT